MRLRALHLENVRKFAGKRASITGIGDGITVVSEANEFGKSTFFDAIHALFFDKYSATSKAIKSLRPYAGGAVGVTAEIEVEAGAFRVEKRFLSRASARVTRLSDASVVAQDDEAERWITGILGTTDTGPAGLLWVRQGQLGLETSGKDEVNNTQTRRDLLSSVSGEIDAMTGGRRMDRVMMRVAEELKPLITKTGRKTGDWKTLCDEIAGMETDLEALNRQIDQLGTALTDRRQVEGQLEALDRPDAKAARDAALAAAQAAFDQATAYVGRIDLAEQAQKLAQIEVTTAQTRLDAFLKAVDLLATTQAEAVRARDVSEAATQAIAREQSVLAQAQAAKTATTRAVSDARLTLESARQQSMARTARTRANDLNVQLQQIETAQKTRDDARARVVASPATQAWLQQVETAQDRVSAHQARLAAQAASVTMRYTGSDRVTQGGKALPDAVPVALTGATELVLPGIGAMSIHLPDADASAQATLVQHQQTLAEMLAIARAETVAEARRLASDRAKASQEADVADAILSTLAPRGADVLRAAKAAADLAGQAAHDDPLPDAPTLEAALAQAEGDDATAQANLTQAERTHAAAREAAIRAQSVALAATQAVDKAAADAGREETRDATRSALIREAAQATDALQSKAQVLEKLQIDAPDLATTGAELTRAKATVDAAMTQRQQGAIRVAALSAEIRAHSENGIEEMRDALSDRLAAARNDEARFADKVAALTRLQSALEAERTAARDTYFGPVQAELKPLLAILYEDAGIRFDSDSLLPDGMMRAQVDEALGDLSGGTQEQIAILTRLAFARLFRGQGRHMPIVLDDALVYSDDGRIMKMFTALTRVADEQQILVFTCRTLAFLSLGGARPEVTVHDI